MRRLSLEDFGPGAVRVADDGTLSAPGGARRVAGHMNVNENENVNANGGRGSFTFTTTFTGQGEARSSLRGTRAGSILPYPANSSPASVGPSSIRAWRLRIGVFTTEPSSAS